MKKNNFPVVVVLTAIFIFWVILTRNNFFHWDEWYFLTGFNQGVSSILKPYGDQYLPFNILNHFILFKTFGLNNRPFQLSVIIFHVINCLVLYKIIILETKNKKIALLATLLFGISNVYNEDLVWSQGISTVGSALFVSLGYLFYLKFIQNMKNKWLIASAISLILSPLFNDFGVLASFAFMVFPYFSKSLQKLRVRISSIYLFSGAVSVLILLLFSGKNVLHSAVPASLYSAFQMVEFVIFGILRGTILRFLYPGFHILKDQQTLKSISFFILAVVVLLFALRVFILWIKDKETRREKINKLIILASLISVGYLAASIGRVSYGLAQAGISRYTYQSFFFLIVLGAYILKDYRDKFRLVAFVLVFAWLINVVAIIQFEQGFWQLMVNRDRQFTVDLRYVESRNQTVYDFPINGIAPKLKISNFWFLLPRSHNVNFISSSKYHENDCQYCSDQRTKEIYKRLSTEYQIKFD